jgi:hypothetical protein
MRKPRKPGLQVMSRDGLEPSTIGLGVTTLSGAGVPAFWPDEKSLHVAKVDKVDRGQPSPIRDEKRNPVYFRVTSAPSIAIIANRIIPANNDDLPTSALLATLPHRRRVDPVYVRQSAPGRYREYGASLLSLALRVVPGLLILATFARVIPAKCDNMMSARRPSRASPAVARRPRVHAPLG